MNSRKFRIYVARRDGSERFSIAILPFRYRKNPTTIKRLAFLSERSFVSEAEAQNEARWLFGTLAWKKTSGTKQQLRASVEFTCKESN
jgi:hypothetical protein